jgi:glutaredoxin
MNMVIYTKDNCSWCVKAKDLMNRFNITYTEKKLGVDFTVDELKEKVGTVARLTVPQIFIKETRIGGYEDLVEYLDNHMGLS